MGKLGLPVNPSVSLEGSDEDDDSDSNTDSDTDYPDDVSAAIVTSDRNHEGGEDDADDDGAVMGDGSVSIAGAGFGRAGHDRSGYRRSDEQLSDEDDDAFSSEAMVELFGSVDTVLEALHGRRVPG